MYLFIYFLSFLFLKYVIFFLFSLVINRISHKCIKIDHWKLEYRRSFDRLERSFDLNNFPKA